MIPALSRTGRRIEGLYPSGVSAAGWIYGRWEGKSRDVRRGEVIGFVGSTGNARGDHLHFETRPGGTPVNPYSIVSAACTNKRDAGSTQDL